MGPGNLLLFATCISRSPEASRSVAAAAGGPPATHNLITFIPHPKQICVVGGEAEMTGRAEGEISINSRPSVYRYADPSRAAAAALFPRNSSIPDVCFINVGLLMKLP